MPPRPNLISFPTTPRALVRQQGALFTLHHTRLGVCLSGPCCPHPRAVASTSVCEKKRASGLRWEEADSTPTDGAGAPGAPGDPQHRGHNCDFQPRVPDMGVWDVLQVLWGSPF